MKHLKLEDMYIDVAGKLQTKTYNSKVVTEKTQDGQYTIDKLKTINQLKDFGAQNYLQIWKIKSAIPTSSLFSLSVGSEDVDFHQTEYFIIMDCGDKQITHIWGFDGEELYPDQVRNSFPEEALNIMENMCGE